MLGEYLESKQTTILSHEDSSKSWIHNLYLLRRKVLMNGSVDRLCINTILPVVDKSLNGFSLEETIPF